MVYWYEGVLLYIASCLVHSYGVDPSREACLGFESDYQIIQEVFCVSHNVSTTPATQSSSPHFLFAEACECVVFQSYGLSQGKFHSPNYPQYYKPGINCILYTFIGDVNELVQIKFVDMDIKAPSPIHYECKDRLRLFLNLDRPEVNENSRHDLELCGNLSNMEAKTFYSSGRALILEFHTDSNVRESHVGFKGVYSFLEKSVFKTDGILQFGTQCSFHMQSDNNHTKGEFYTPRYPQKYPKQSNCQYMFMGQENEKIRVVFKHIRLPSGSARSCSEKGDSIKVYDGRDDKSKLLKTYCDIHNQQELTSSGPYLYIEFTSDRHKEKQGFAAEYQFLDRTYAPPNESKGSGTRNTSHLNSKFLPSNYFFALHILLMFLYVVIM